MMTHLASFCDLLIHGVRGERVQFIVPLGEFLSSHVLIQQAMELRQQYVVRGDRNFGFPGHQTRLVG
jgi:hypothetical protein